MPRFSADGGNLYYEVHGTGQPILGIHGTPSSALLWVDAARELATLGPERAAVAGGHPGPG